MAGEQVALRRQQDSTWMKRKLAETGYFWAIARDDRPWSGTDPPAVVYTYVPGRGGEHLEKLLADYHGIVQCDGYAPY
jgi:hypothetical protein